MSSTILWTYLLKVKDFLKEEETGLGTELKFDMKVCRANNYWVLRDVSAAAGSSRC